MGRKRKILDPDNSSKTNLPPCRVCDAPGAGFHYGANTCEACKGFFHRSLKLNEQYKCDGVGQCAIEHGKEKLCQKCRYQKCLSVGMGKDAIKTGRYTSVKRTNDILEVKKLQQTGRIKHSDNNMHSSSSQILKLLTSPRADSNSGSQSSCDHSIGQNVLSTQSRQSDSSLTEMPFPQTELNLQQSQWNFPQTELNFPQNQHFPISTVQTFVQLPPCNKHLASSHTNCDNTNQPVRTNFSPSEIVLNEKSFLKEMAATASNLSPLAVLSATASAVLNSKHGFSPLTPPEKLFSPEPLMPLDNGLPASPFTPANDFSNMSPLSIRINGPSSNSSTASPTCLGSQTSAADFLGSFCDSCGCTTKDADLSALYQDQNKVIKTLLEAHECFVVPVFGRLTPEEQLKQQLEHLENCRLHREIFGTLPRLPDNEYDDIFEKTGLDTDGRQLRFSKVSLWMENMIRGMVKFAKAIPGFGKVQTSDKVNLIKYSRQEFCVFSIYKTLNCELRVMRGADNEWKCEYDIAKAGNISVFRDFLEKHFNFCHKLQKLNLTEEEQVVIKAILIMAPDRFPPVESSLTHEIYWCLIKCLLHLLSQRHQNANLKYADIISRLTEARTMTENSITFLKNLKIEKYSNILENPLLREMMAGIIFDFKEDET